MRGYKANMIPGGVTPTINVSQYDNDYAVTVTLIEGAEIYTPPVGATIRVEGTKPDGHGFEYPCTYQGNVVTMPIYTQMTVVSGRFPIELVVYQSGLRVGSCNIIFAVERAPLGEDTDISETVIPDIIAGAQAQANAAAASATTASSAATNAVSARNAAIEAAQAAAQSAASLTVDTELSSTSTNPVQNKVIDATVTELKNETTELKSALSGLSGTETTWEDGYISSSDGQLKPPTADAQKSSDFIPVINGTNVKAIIRHSASRYRSASIFAYASDKSYISRLVYIDGSTATTFEISTTIENQNIAYVRISYASFNDDLGTQIYVYSNIRNEINSAISPIVADIDKIRELDLIRFQYLDTSKWESGYYNWNQSQTALQKNDGGANWFCMEVVDIPAGTYKYNKFCSLAFSFIENQTTGEIVKLSDIGVTETNNGTVTINYDFNLWLSITIVYFDKTITMFASGSLPSEYVYGWYKDTAASNYVNAQGQTVWIVGNGYIPTIQAACDAASPNDIIFVRVGTYTEQVSIWNKKLHIIGENKANTILIDHSGAYNTPPLEMSLGSLSNMTIIEDGTQPTLQPGESGYNGAYCLHIEWTPPANEVFLIENCDFINYVHSPLGCGLYQDYTVHFKDCTFRCEATDEGNMERGSFYFHSNIQPNVTGQKIIAENCIISSAGQRGAVLLGVPAGANNTGSAEARFSGCTIWNDNVGTADSIAYFDTSGGADVLKVVHSCGNTVDILNNW